MKIEHDYLRLLDLTYQVIQSLEGKTYSDPRFYDCDRLAA